MAAPDLHGQVLPDREPAEDAPPFGDETQAGPGPGVGRASLHRGALPPASSISIAAMLLGRITSPTRAARRAEMQVRLQDVLNSMDPIDREVLTLRHFEELGNSETAQVLGISKSAASSRYIRAVMRLKKELASMPGLFDA